MEQTTLIPHLFRTEYRKLTSVLCKLFGIEYIEIAEDIVSDTFLLATETWGIRGLPENPTAWIYTVAKNKAKNYFKHHSIFANRVSKQLKYLNPDSQEMDIDFSEKNIVDSQLKMMFAICDPSIPVEAQIALSLRILCGFGIEEIATALLSNKETIKKKLLRGKEKLRTEKVRIEVPNKIEINNRMETVLTTLYLLFNEGYYSASSNVILRKDLCLEAMRLTHLLIEYEFTNQPNVNALLSIMCFQASRFEARTNQNGDIILYDNQDETLWNLELIIKGQYYLSQASKGNVISKYHYEAGIAYWHTNKSDDPEKWGNILHLYNQLLMVEYSPVAALNRTYALSKARGKAEAIKEAEKLDLSANHFYYSLLGELYIEIDNLKAKLNFEKALMLSKNAADKKMIISKILKLQEKNL